MVRQGLQPAVTRPRYYGSANQRALLQEITHCINRLIFAKVVVCAGAVYTLHLLRKGAGFGACSERVDILVVPKNGHDPESKANMAASAKSHGLSQLKEQFFEGNSQSGRSKAHCFDPYEELEYEVRRRIM